MDDFYLFANCNFVPDKYDDWQSAYSTLATHVHLFEPSTKTYYFGLPLSYSSTPSLSTSMLAFEIYTSREALYTTHLSSPSMSRFLSEIPASSTTGLDLAHYSCVAGFLDGEEGAREECEVMQDVRIRCVSGSARSHVVEKLKGLVGGVKQGEEGVLTYMAFISLDDEVGARMFGRWRTRSDMERFIRRQEVIGFWMECKEWVAGMEQRLYAPNGKGWLHRGDGFAGEKKKKQNEKARL